MQNLPALDRIAGEKQYWAKTARVPRTAQLWRKLLVPWLPVMKAVALTTAQPAEIVCSTGLVVDDTRTHKLGSAAIELQLSESKQLAWLLINEIRSFRHLTLQSSSSSGKASISTSLGIAL